MKNSTAKILHYTIVEMMMVVAVFMIILSMAMAAWLNSGSQAHLKNAARLVSAQLNLAKAKAVANLANSAGCKLTGPNFNQEYDPLMSSAKNGVTNNNSIINA